ncbi:ATP-dependent DNA ligase, partial [bacterium]|nr:ATP-dependent DNA ligase [bacterium]
MHLERQLYRKSRTGATLSWKIIVEDNDNKIQRTYGHHLGKQQHTEEIVEGKNIGKSNETTPHEQAVKEAQAVIDKKTKEGFRDKLTTQIFTFEPLPEGFTPSKPISAPPEGTSMSKGLEGFYAERKYNGVNLLLVVDLKNAKHLYTRGIEEITHLIADIPEIKKLREYKVPAGSITSFEFIYFNLDGIETPKDLRAFTQSKSTKEKIEARYQKLKDAGGHLEIKIFDMLFFDKKDITKTDFSDRRVIIKKIYYDKDATYEPWSTQLLTKEHIDIALEQGWEGFVLRHLTGSTSHIEYTMNGKAYRRGAWKLKFLWTEDYFIYEFMTSNAGKLKGLPARFHLGKLDAFGERIDCGWCGPGTLGIAGLEVMGKKLGWSSVEKLPYKTAFPVSDPLTV